ncbi:MAG: molybdopterin-guanine dinucleotide biosynthesis protein B [Dehalococcoidia bacterium]
MPPVISVVGRAKSGKTTLLEKIIAELRFRGHSVATIKHTTHRVEIDKPGKDTWRHLHAGSNSTTIVSANNIVLIKPVEGNITPDEIVRLYGEDYDIVLIEGFKQSNYPKIEVHRKAVGPVLNNMSKVIAYATDEQLETSLKQFSLHDSTGIVDFIENNYLNNDCDNTSIYINNEHFPSDKISDISLKSLVTSLINNIKENTAIEKLTIFIKQRH